MRYQVETIEIVGNCFCQMYVKIKQTFINPANYPVGKTGKQTFLKIMGAKTGLSRGKGQ